MRSDFHFSYTKIKLMNSNKTLRILTKLLKIPLKNEFGTVSSG